MRDTDAETYEKHADEPTEVGRWLGARQAPGAASLVPGDPSVPRPIASDRTLCKRLGLC